MALRSGAPVKTVKNVSAAYMLKLIVKFLNRGDVESENLWYILTALRGPDSGDFTVKEETTQRLRGRIGVKGWEDCMVSDGPIQVPESGGYHFTQHIKKAKIALGYMNLLDQNGD